MSELGSDFEEDTGPYLGEYEGERNEREERHGQGKATLPNGDIYEGTYKDGKRHGLGNYRFKNGAKYVGEYVKNKKHGMGEFHYPDGSKYEGGWVEDQRSGFGKYKYANGDMYEGQWEFHVRHGQGVYTYADTNTKYTGTWHLGKCVGQGEIIYANHKYVGPFRDNRPDGKGKFVFDAGCQQYGEYIPMEVGVEAGKEEEDEFVPRIVSRWKASHITEIMVEEEEEKKEAHTTEHNAFEAVEAV